MYKIFADDTLIYDSTIDDYKIGAGTITLEVNKSGSFVFSVYPDNIFYDSFVKLKTVITVYKSGKIVFRGRILNDVTDYWNNKKITCEGELGFLKDSISRPFVFDDSPANLLKKFIEEHNSQVDDFKKFKIGNVTVTKKGSLSLNSTSYSDTLSTLAKATIDSSLGGYLFITHGEDGTDPIPTLNYLADFTNVSSQTIEFGSNLKNYTKSVKAEDMATAIIPFGASLDSNSRLTIEEVNDGLDYVYSKAGVELYGWIFKTVVWDDIIYTNRLKEKAEEYLESVVNQNITIELNAIDLHLLDKSIESFRVCDYVPVKSEPHKLDAVLLCNKQTIDLLKPENDTVVLGCTTTSFSGTSSQLQASVTALNRDMSSISQKVDEISLEVDNGETSSTIWLKAGSATISSKEITFKGMVTFKGLSDGTTSIDGACIKTGTINAERINLTDAISWGNLTTELKNTITKAINDATDASGLAGSAQLIAESVANGEYSGGTFIDGKSIYAPEIYATEFNVYPDVEGDGSFNLYGQFYDNIYHVLSIEYHDGGEAPYVNFTSPINGYATWEFGQTYFYGDVDFSGATVLGLDDLIRGIVEEYL